MVTQSQPDSTAKARTARRVRGSANVSVFAEAHKYRPVLRPRVDEDTMWLGD
jgi:hypothetical protein